MFTSNLHSKGNFPDISGTYLKSIKRKKTNSNKFTNTPN